MVEYSLKKFPVSVKEMCQRFEKIPVADLYDVMDRGGYELGNQVLSLKIKPIDRHMHVAGPAFTLKGQREMRLEDELPMRNEGKFADFGMFRAVFPDCVVVVNAEAEPHTGCFGSMMSRSVKNQGARGVVIDGGTRDAADILRIPNFSMFCRHWSPIESYKRWRWNDFMVPIAMSGTLTSQVRVNPYDWIVGDWDAVIVIPQEIAYDVLLKAEEMEAAEERTRHDLDRGDSVWEVYERYGRL
mgnify:CR=1 FL=1